MPNSPVFVAVVDVEQYDDGYPAAGSLLGFRDWLNGIIERIPEQYRSDAEIDITTRTDFAGTAWTHIKVGYRSS